HTQFVLVRPVVAKIAFVRRSTVDPIPTRRRQPPITPDPTPVMGAEL
ncbi:hypothetical protein PR003_g34072, partial [Phytophthora rubi]